MRAAWLVWILSIAAGAAAAENPRWTMMVEIAGREVEGMPLAWSSQHVFLLARDGRLWDFPPNKSGNFRKTSSFFSSYSTAEMRAALERELGGALDITLAGHYLVAHPRGKEAWARRFDQLYRSCIHYFSSRRLTVHEPEFPLVAIVWSRRDDFARYALSQGTPVRPDVLGFYSPSTNRVTLFDQAQGATTAPWQQNEATIIHEATHQMAFNTGVHNRFSPTPMWLAEGFGTMFEARGVWDWHDYPRLSDRVNRMRLLQFRQWVAHGRISGAFTALLSSDQLFQTNPQVAYAESWAWVLFLTEVHSQKFSQYVQRISTRKDFQEYPAPERVADFTAFFGENLSTLERNFLVFMDALP